MAPGAGIHADRAKDHPQPNDTSSVRETSQTITPQIEELKSKGNELFKQGKFVEACLFYSKAIHIDDANCVLYGNRAACYCKLEKWKEALEDAEKCIQINSKWFKGYVRKAVAQRGAGNYKQAVDTLTYCLQLMTSPTETDNNSNNSSSSSSKRRTSSGSSNSNNEAMIFEVNCMLIDCARQVLDSPQSMQVDHNEVLDLIARRHPLVNQIKTNMVSLLIDQIEAVRMPDIENIIDTRSIGVVGYSVAGFKISNVAVDREATSVEMGDLNTIKIFIDDIRAQIEQVKWSFAQMAFPRIKDSGTLKINIAGMRVALLLTISDIRRFNGYCDNLQIYFDACNINIKTLNVSFTRCKYWLIYHTLASIFATQVKSVIAAAISMSLKQNALRND